MDLYPNAIGSPTALSGGVPLQNVGQDVGTHPRLNDARATVDSAACEPIVQSISRNIQSVAIDSVLHDDEDDDLPPLASDSESELGEPEDIDSHHSDDSMPSLQTVSDSSDSDYNPAASDLDEPEDEQAEESRENVTAAASNAPANIAVPEPLDSDEAYDDDEEEDSEVDDSDDYDEWQDDVYEETMAMQEAQEILAGGTHIAEMLEIIGRLRPAVDNDPLRAETLLEGLEEVSHDLVKRYEKLRGGLDDDNEGCAICRDEFVDDVAADPLEPAKLSDAVLTSVLFEALPFHPPPCTILAFPCLGRHLFHSNCLAPWLARKTTCPSCRFDIDPDSLTLRTVTASSQLIDEQFDTRKLWEPPRVSSFATWIEQAELAREREAKGIPIVKAVPVDREVDDCPADDEREDMFHPPLAVPNQHNADAIRHSGDVSSGRQPPSTPSAPTTDAATFPGFLPSIRQGRMEHIMAMLGVETPSSRTAMDLHDSMLEDVMRALRMGRASVAGMRPPQARPQEDPRTDDLLSQAPVDID